MRKARFCPLCRPLAIEGVNRDGRRDHSAQGRRSFELQRLKSESDPGITATIGGDYHPHDNLLPHDCYLAAVVNCPRNLATGIDANQLFYYQRIVLHRGGVWRKSASVKTSVLNAWDGNRFVLALLSSFYCFTCAP